MRIVEISAWNDSGGGFLNRLLDGHADLHAWPFELLLGADGGEFDGFGENWFRGRFRWPRLGDVTQVDGAVLFDRIADIELKAVLSDPGTAKHRDFAIAVDVKAWRQRVTERWQAQLLRTQAAFLTTYVTCFFELWRGEYLAPDARILAHCPVAILDAPEIWADFPDARIIHVIRRPEPGFVDMQSRHPDLAPERYALKWSMVNGFAATLAGKYPNRVRLMTLDALLSQRAVALGGLCDWLGIAFCDAILEPSWNGRTLDPAEMGPFGGVPNAVAEAERDAAALVAIGERKVIAEHCTGTISLLNSLPGVSM